MTALQQEIADLRAQLSTLTQERDTWYRVCDLAWTAVDETELAEPDESLPAAVRSLRERAEAAERQVTSLTADLAQKDAELAALRGALVGFIGASEPNELKAMELEMCSLPTPEAAIVAKINAIGVLLQYPPVLPREDQP